MLLDEPTVGLDVHSRAEVVRTVRALAASDGVGVLWATHLFDEIEPADEIVLLHKGRVLAVGHADQLAGGRDIATAFLELTENDPGAAP